VRRLSVTAPVLVLLLGCCLLGAGIAGVARVDAPLRAAATQQQAPPVHHHDVDVIWHRRHHADCPPPPLQRT
jgi:hypothetical protein